MFLAKSKQLKTSLAQYVKRRNGVPLGGKGALREMLYRSLGAGSFQDFWKFWNPIWSYYLAKYSFLPLKKIFPVWLSIILTFAISGALHDLAIVLLTQKLSFIITIWFSIMGTVLVSLSRLKITYTTFPLVIRGLINLGLILLSYGIAKLLLIAVDG